MPRRLRTWRFTFWAALIPSALLAIAAAANIIWAYGLIAPGGRFVCWCDGKISLGVNSDFDTFECFADTRQLLPNSGSIAFYQWPTVRAFADHCIDIPAWLAPLPTLGICVLAYKMTRVPLIPRCRKCRYDLRGLVAGPNGKAICPECGAEARP